MPGKILITPMGSSLNGWNRNGSLLAGRRTRFLYSIWMPACASGASFGDSNASNWSDERFVLRLPRSRTPLK